MAIQAPKGTKDVLPVDAYKWQYLENKFRDLAAIYGCKEIRTPIFESTELFTRGVGETTDVVQKEMYTFLDKGERSITLKPEGTAPTARAFIENSLFNDAQPTKLFYIIPAFRYENVQKGRLRQFHQFGIEAFGSQEASIDAEIISLAMRAFSDFGIKGLELNINSIGCPKCRKIYNEALQKFLNENLDNLCDLCKSRFDKNPMRILDCKNKKCKEIVKDAPNILDYLCDDCEDHFEKLKSYLEAMEIEYKIDPLIVRGLDYYTKTVFEIIKNDITVCGGGRYDGLIEEIGGPKLPAFGFALGIERLLMTLAEEKIEIPKPNYIDLFVASMDENSKIQGLKLINAIREKGIKCESNHMSRNVKGQMKYSNKIEATFTIVLGETEVDTKKAKLKRMSDGEQLDIDLNDIDGIVTKLSEKII